MKYIKLFENFNISNGIIVNSKNKPITFYHGGTYTGGEFRGVIWFTVDRSDAKYYADQNGGVVSKAHLISNNPLYSGNIKHLNIELTDDMISSMKKRSEENSVIVNDDNIIEYIETNFAVILAQDIGRDSVIDLHDGEIVDVIVWNNEQIKIIE